jgi:hypothetical protein
MSSIVGLSASVFSGSAAATPAVPAFAPVRGSTFTTGLNAMSFSSNGKLLATANFNDRRRDARSDASLV